MRLIPIPAWELDEHLQDIMPALESFADRSRGRFTPEYFIQGIRDRHYQCWKVTNGETRAVALTQVNQDDLNTVTITHCAGQDAAAWVHLIEQFKLWAKQRGSKRIEAITRPGWERYLKPAGFVKKHVILEVDV